MTKSEKRTISLPNLERSPPSDFKPLGGSKYDGWNQAVATSLAQALATASPPYADDLQEEARRANLTALAEMNAADPIEGVLQAQILAANAMAMELQRRAWLENQSFEARSKFLALANKAMRTTAMLVEALNRHKGKGKQQITVRHVTVNAGQAIVADNVNTAPGGWQQKREDQPHASQITDARQPAMSCDFEADREAVPGTRRKGT